MSLMPRLPVNSDTPVGDSVEVVTVMSVLLILSIVNELDDGVAT